MESAGDKVQPHDDGAHLLCLHCPGWSLQGTRSNPMMMELIYYACTAQDGVCRGQGPNL